MPLNKKTSQTNQLPEWIAVKCYIFIEKSTCYIIAEGFFFYIIIFRWLYLIFQFS